MFAHEGTHSGSALRRSAASPQELFLLEGSFACHRAWHLTLRNLGSSDPPQSPLSFCSCSSHGAFLVIHTLCVSTRALSTELFSSPHAACGWELTHWSPCACSPVRGTGAQPCGHHSRCCEALFRRASRPTSARCRLDRAPWPCSVVEVAWFTRPILFRLLRVARLRLLTPAAVAAYADQVPRGQRAPLDQFRTLLIDWSAKSVESSLPFRGGTWRRTREHQSPTHAADSSRDSSRGSLRRHALWIHLDLHVEAVMSYHHSHRQLSVLTHLDLPVEANCRSSFLR